ncbi:succinyl-CoA synthetase, beta subunit [Candidatus Filomicrobium marinum]|uniref:Succinate--CoA ligase [ADP-forming] subunit beta n=2 Tax=Filomicrobium TaxID=119044 RepID=A0A0D6JCD1_9HYPH|nr:MULTISPECIES: ADP-forming succinate--CoA ligase subunit beta [Filomicrobium]MCV0368437.1 ADP-forming succinate--CoA ligase subunit beta [Filomicrobium sp.]CFX10591.1 succinyl-CoA synthetase, beta subunit [Candidatus Filomicrobium marinum]CPR17146.1 succinyl-CoA synthetase, beta subunit [Candidatus Filomicrobium marinum]SDO39041.1 succinyl-CoA synthetase beta subunit [Filomicrobium insigne]
MNIHEYQAKELYRQYGVPTPTGYPAFTVDEAVAAAQKLPGPVWVVKAQIHAGGRGKGSFKEAEAGDKGGVRLAKSIDEVKEFANQMLGKTLVTVQTGAAGRQVNRLYIEDGSAIERELYLSALVDRATSRVAFIVSQDGGMDIEKVAHDTPERITTLSIDPASGFQQFHGRKVAFALGLKGDQVKQCVKMVNALYNMVIEKDMSLLEINPLVVTKDGSLIALDGKMDFDSNALFRHAEIVEMRDLAEEDPMELEASKYDLSYVKLDGNIGCMVNGAGLAMATMDIIKLYGAEPANFLDVGGGASKEKVQAAFKIILNDPAVKGILVNIFGGIMRCDIIAEGVVAAAREMEIKVPLVVRLEGTNVDLGKKILSESGLKIIPADDLADAAKKITDEVKAVA